MKEWGIKELIQAYHQGKTNPVKICKEYLQRIESIDKQINSIIEINPDALSIAEKKNAELKNGNYKGLLFGIPVLLKDNIDTNDKMETTAGSLAFKGYKKPEDSFIVKRLRAEGAIILGKTNLSEWANFRSPKSNSGWSSRGGQTRNPYALDRSPCGSSSGSAAAVAANLCVAAIGTETDGSIICPASANSIAGFKPSIGYVSRTGIIPIAKSQDTAGPMTRTIEDATILMQAISGKDSEDSASCDIPNFLESLTQKRTPNSIKGKRLGIVTSCCTFNASVSSLFFNALKKLQNAGAVIVENCDILNSSKTDANELTVLLYEFKDGMKKYLKRRGGSFSEIADIIQFNEQNKETVMPHFGQELMLMIKDIGNLDEKKYIKAKQENLRYMKEEGIDKVISDNNLDALIAPSNGPSWLIDHINGDYYTGNGISSPPAIAGYPHITVPMGYVQGLPIGVSLIGRLYSDAFLLSTASGIELVLAAREIPKFLKTVK